jgi:hypothetical protein
MPTADQIRARAKQLMLQNLHVWGAGNLSNFQKHVFNSYPAGYPVTRNNVNRTVTNSWFKPYKH